VYAADQSARRELRTFSGSNAFANRAREQLADAQREASLSFTDEEQLKEGLKSLGVVPPAAERAELAAELLRSEADAWTLCMGLPALDGMSEEQLAAEIEGLRERPPAAGAAGTAGGEAGGEGAPLPAEAAATSGRPALEAALLRARADRWRRVGYS